MMAAMGQAPHILALQQGTQVAGIFHQIGNGQKIIAALGSAFLGLLNPISLVTIGIIGVGTALFQYFMSSEDEANAAEEVFKRHSATVAALKDAYGEAAGGLREFAKESEVIARALAIVDKFALEDQLASQVSAIVGSGELFAQDISAVNDEIVRLQNELAQTVEADAYRAIEEQITALHAAIKDGSAGIPPPRSCCAPRSKGSTATAVG